MGQVICWQDAWRGATPPSLFDFWNALSYHAPSFKDCDWYATLAKHSPRIILFLGHLGLFQVPKCRGTEEIPFREMVYSITGMLLVRGSLLFGLL